MELEGFLSEDRPCKQAVWGSPFNLTRHTSGLGVEVAIFGVISFGDESQKQNPLLPLGEQFCRISRPPTYSLGLHPGASHDTNTNSATIKEPTTGVVSLKGSGRKGVRRQKHRVSRSADAELRATRCDPGAAFSTSQAPSKHILHAGRSDLAGGSLRPPGGTQERRCRLFGGLRLSAADPTTGGAP